MGKTFVKVTAEHDENGQEGCKDYEPGYFRSQGQTHVDLPSSLSPIDLELS